MSLSSRGQIRVEHLLCETGVVLACVWEGDLPLDPTVFPPIPMNTTKATQAIFGRSNFYLAIGDQVNHLFSGLVLEDLAAQLQNPPRTLAMLYLITIFQYVETLPDHFVPDALRERVDWKYALHLPLNALQPGSLPLCEFRKMCLKERSDAQNFQMLMKAILLPVSYGSDLLLV